MSANESSGSGPPNGPDHDEGYLIVETPAPERNGNTVTENEITDGMSDVHVSETAGARRKDEYEVDFE